jgi:hypothetical protein
LESDGPHPDTFSSAFVDARGGVCGIIPQYEGGMMTGRMIQKDYPVPSKLEMMLPP